MLIYKKILLSPGEESESNSPESQDQKIKDLQREIKELRDRDTENDEISKVFKDNALTEGFSDALERADRGTINELVKKLSEAIGKMKDSNSEKGNAGKLLDALKKIQATRIYTDFKEMIAPDKIKRLNSFKDYEISVLKDNIAKENGAITLEDALNLYKKMLTIGAGAKLLPTDRRYFNDIKDAIEEKGGFKDEDSDKKIDKANEKLSEYQLDTLFPSDITSNKLKSLANTYAGVTDWDGAELTDQTITLKDGESFTAEDFKTKFNTVNQARIDKNNRIVNGLDITLPDNFNTEKFQLDDKGNLKYKVSNTEQRDVTAADMLSSLNLPLEDVDFVDENEKNTTLQEKFEKFCNAVKYKLNQTDASDNNVNNPTDVSAETSGIERCTLNDRGFDLINNALGAKNFITKNDGKFEYDMNKLTGFLGSINSGNRREYRNLSRGQGRTVGSGNWKALHCAVQILLNKNEKANLNVNGQWIHSKRNPGRNAYYNAVYKFQTANSLKQDGIPGLDTIKKLLEKEGGAENGNDNADGSNNGTNVEGDESAPRAEEITGVEAL